MPLPQSPVKGGRGVLASPSVPHGRGRGGERLTNTAGRVVRSTSLSNLIAPGNIVAGPSKPIKTVPSLTNAGEPNKVKDLPTPPPHKPPPTSPPTTSPPSPTAPTSPKQLTRPQSTGSLRGPQKGPSPRASIGRGGGTNSLTKPGGAAGRGGGLNGLSMPGAGRGGGRGAGARPSNTGQNGPRLRTSSRLQPGELPYDTEEVGLTLDTQPAGQTSGHNTPQPPGTPNIPHAMPHGGRSPTPNLPMGRREDGGGGAGASAASTPRQGTMSGPPPPGSTASTPRKSAVDAKMLSPNNVSTSQQSTPRRMGSIMEKDTSPLTQAHPRTMGSLFEPRQSMEQARSMGSIFEARDDVPTMASQSWSSIPKLRLPAGNDGIRTSASQSSTRATPEPGHRSISSCKSRKEVNPNEALFGGSTFIGPVGHDKRIQQKDWQLLVEKHHRNARHPQAMGDPIVMQEMENHPKHESDYTKQELDNQLVMDVHGEDYAFSSSPRSLQSTPRPSDRTASPMPLNMTSAFTDRSLRMKEALRSRAGFTPAYSVNGENKPHKDCKCPVCQPFQVKAAGQASDRVQNRRYPRCLQGLAKSDDQGQGGSMAGSASSVASNSPMTERRRRTHKDILIHAGSEHSAGYADEALVETSMGRKARTLTRSQSEDVIAAGCHPIREPGIPLRRGARCLGPADDAGRNVTPCLTERHRDPPDIFSGKHGQAGSPKARDPAVMACGVGKRMSGEFKGGASAFSQKLACNEHQELLRFDQRSQSAPPLRSRGAYNPVTQEDGTKAAGRRTVTEAMKDTAGKYRRASVSLRPKALVPKYNNTWDSTGIGGITQTVSMDELKEERHARLSNDPSFAMLCEVTDRLKQQQLQEVQTIRMTQDKTASYNMANSLRWEEHRGSRESDMSHSVEGSSMVSGCN